VFISAEMLERSMEGGCVKFRERWIPELRTTQSRLGCCLITLIRLLVCGLVRSEEGEGTNDPAKEGIEERSVMSNVKDDAFSFPCLETKESRFSFRRPTAIT
jgi:hypothetical protein